MARLSTAMVLERTSKDPESVYKFVQNASDGLAAQKTAVKLAEQFPGRVFVPASLWPPVMAKEVRKVTFLNPDDPDGKMDDDDVSDVVVAATRLAKSEPKPEVKTETKPEVKAEVKPEIKVEAKPEAKPEVKVETKPIVKDEPVKSNVSLAEPTKVDPPAPKPAAVKPVAKPAPVKPVEPSPAKAADPASSAFGELFGNDSSEPESFVNEDDDDEPKEEKEEDAVPSLF